MRWSKDNGEDFYTRDIHPHNEPFPPRLQRGQTHIYTDRRHVGLYLRISC